MANPAFPWPVWTVAWLWSMPVACVSHWDTQTGSCGAGSLELGDDGGSGRRGLAGASVLGDAIGYGLRERTQKKEGFGV